MTKQEIENKIAELKTEFEKKIDELKQLAEDDAKTPKGEIWRPKKGEKYYYLNGDGESASYGCFDDDSTDKWLIKTGNFYRTKEEAEFEAECERYTRLYRKYVKEHSEPLDWNNQKQSKWLALYDFMRKTLYFSCNSFIKQQGTIYASSEQIIRDAIDFIGEDNFLKYVLRIKEKDNAEN